MLKESVLRYPKFSLSCAAGSQLRNTQFKLVMGQIAVDNWWQIAVQKTYSQAGASLAHPVASALCPDSTQASLCL